VQSSARESDVRRFDVFKMFGELSEAIGDDKVDNMVDELKSVLEVELSMFLISLLNTNFSLFEKSYTNPQYEGFRRALTDLQQRFKVMDQLAKQDLFNKIEIVFKDIFRTSYSAMGPETAELIATRYASQMNKNLKAVMDDPQAALKDIYYKDDEKYPNGINANEQPPVETGETSVHASQPPFDGHIY
jgi:hypothetical protein